MNIASHQPNSGVDLKALASAVDQSSAIAIVDVSLDGRAVNANAAMLKLLKVESLDELQNMDFKREILSDAGYWECWRSVVTRGSQENVEIRCRAVDGQEVVLSGDIRLVDNRRDGMVTLLGLFADVTRSKQMMQALQRTARMEAVGNISSGIAHDVNNLLTVLLGNLYLVAESVRSDPAQFDKVRRARNAAKRGADLTRQLLSFARGGHAQPSVVDPGKLISNLEPLLERTIGSKISLGVGIEQGIWPIDASAAQLESVIVNLVINARDAIAGTGKIVIKASNAEIDNGRQTTSGLSAGKYVRISVADNGPGIPGALLGKVFEPFFTTKPDGQGTGLGLSMVRWFCEQAGGEISLKSRPGRGTKLTLVLPRSKESTAETTLNTMPLSVLPTGDEKVLILAEDGEIRATVQQILETLGYTVHVNADPEQCIDYIRQDEIDLIVIDSGSQIVPEQLDSLVNSRPNGRRICTLSLEDSRTTRSGAASATLLKPFSLLDLATTVRRTLDGDEKS